MEEKVNVQSKFPTEIVDLPSKGLLYPKDSPLSSGQIELKYMTTKEEDILTSQNLIQKGVVIDKLLQSVIVTPIDYNELYNGDKNAIMIATRVLGYGADYEVGLTCPHCGEKTETTIDLLKLSEREPLDWKLFNNMNEFQFTLPFSKRVLTFKLLQHKDEKKIDEELRFIKKINRSESKAELTTRLKHMIISIDGDSDQKVIREFVDNEMISKDSFEFRKYIKEISPDVDMTYPYVCENCGHENIVTVPMTVQFFWPNAGV